jgi:hypothetical protein
VNHQFQSANEAMDLHNSIEVSGFGKFYFNNKKAKKRIISLIGKKQMMESHLANPNATEQKKHAAKVTLDKTETLINFLKTKITDDED